MGKLQALAFSLKRTQLVCTDMWRLSISDVLHVWLPNKHMYQPAIGGTNIR